MCGGRGGGEVRKGLCPHSKQPPRLCWGNAEGGGEARGGAARLPGRAGGLMPASASGLRPQGRDLLGLAEPLVQPGCTGPLLPRRPPAGRAHTLDLRKMTPTSKGDCAHGRHLSPEDFCAPGCTSAWATLLTQGFPPPQRAHPSPAPQDPQPGRSCLPFLRGARGQGAGTSR